MIGKSSAQMALRDPDIRLMLRVRDDDSYESVGATDDGREVYLVWRWDLFDPSRVFPITAYFLPIEGAP